MKSLKKKKGSSLVMVLMLSSAIMLVATVSMTAISMDVKMRSEENKRVQSLYGADSGLEYVNHLLNKTFEAATTYADTEVSKGNSSRMTEEERNEAFKTHFQDYLNLDEEKENEFKQAILTGEYLKYNPKATDSKERVALDFSANGTVEPTFDVEVDTSRVADEPYRLDVTSTFESVTEGINNERSVTTTFTIKIPDYQGEVGSSTVDIYPVFHDKVLTSDGNLNINNSETNFIGDVFVVGNSPQQAHTSENLAFSKYEHGIAIDESAVTFTNDVITPKTLNISGKKPVNLQQHLYAQNLYIGNLDGSYSIGNENTNKKELIVNQAILDNDLMLKARASEVEINSFYGLNDKTYTASDTSNPSEKVERTSSSIIVNNYNEAPSTLRINHEAYIMGVAYLNTLHEKYQTGESVAVKGNYVAYTMPLSDEDDPGEYEYDDYQFNYYEPLQLVEKMKVDCEDYLEDDDEGEDVDTIDDDDNDDNPYHEQLCQQAENPDNVYVDMGIIEKSNYFQEFYLGEDFDDDGATTIVDPNTGIKHGGVILPDTVYSAGAVVYRTGDNIKVEKTSFDYDSNELVNEARRDYGKEVYAMGHYEEDNDKMDDLMDLYQSFGVDGKQQTVAGSLQLENVKSVCKIESNEEYCNNGIYTKDNLVIVSDKTLVLGSKSTSSGYSGKSEYLSYNPESKSVIEPMEAFIIVDGDVIIDGDFNFTGNIIATGTVTIKDNSSQPQRLVYDEAVTESILAANYETVKDLFNDEYLIESKEVGTSSGSETGQYDPKAHVTESNWQLLH